MLGKKESGQKRKNGEPSNSGVKRPKKEEGSENDESKSLKNESPDLTRMNYFFSENEDKEDIFSLYEKSNAMSTGRILQEITNGNSSQSEGNLNQRSNDKLTSPPKNPSMLAKFLGSDDPEEVDEKNLNHDKKEAEEKSNETKDYVQNKII